MSLYVPDKNGQLRDIVLGFDNLEDYRPENHLSDFGAIIGRYANRLCNGQISIGGRTYQLPQNDGQHCLHGGPDGWQYRLFTVEEVNERQKAILFDKLNKRFDGNLKGKTVTLWGLAFKPETDDMREAPALVLINKLVDAGCTVKVFDPEAMDECRRRVGDKVRYGKDMYDATVDADALILVTEWKTFRMPSWEVLARSMRNKLVIDGRNIYDAAELAESGFEYCKIG